MSPLAKYFLFILLPLFALVSGYGLIMRDMREWPVGSEDIDILACTQEGKLCPDGSAVSRTGFNCEFAVCPGEGKAEALMFGEAAEASCGPQPPAECAADMRLGCEKASGQWACYADTSAWKTYRNEEYGFEVRYPQEYMAGNQLSPATIFEFPGIVAFVSLDASRAMPGEFTIMLFDKHSVVSVKNLIAEQQRGYYRNDSVTSDVSLCGSSGRRYASNTSRKLGVYLERGAVVYAIHWHRYNEEDLQGLNRFDKIVSNFRCSQ